MLENIHQWYNLNQSNGGNDEEKICSADNDVTDQINSNERDERIKQIAHRICDDIKYGFLQNE